MRLTKFAGLVKRFSYCGIYHLPNGCVWLGQRGAKYYAGGLPVVHGEEQVRAVLSIDRGQMERVTVQEFECPDAANVNGENFTDYDPTERPAELCKFQITWNNRTLPEIPVLTEDGGVLFFYQSFLAPIEDEVKDWTELSFFVRKSYWGWNYIAVKKGMFLLALLSAHAPSTESDLNYMRDFLDRFAKQYYWSRGMEPPDEDAEPEEGQIELDLGEDSGEAVRWHGA
jgi:hypothetical protein